MSLFEPFSCKAKEDLIMQNVRCCNFAAHFIKPLHLLFETEY